MRFIALRNSKNSSFYKLKNAFNNIATKSNMNVDELK